MRENMLKQAMFGEYVNQIFVDFSFLEKSSIISKLLNSFVNNLGRYLNLINIKAKEIENKNNLVMGLNGFRTSLLEDLNL